jgi:hypothetical protein
MINDTLFEAIGDLEKLELVVDAPSANGSALNGGADEPR